jgi:hypothetical protein
MFTSIYSDGGGREVHETFEVGRASYKVWEPNQDFPTGVPREIVTEKNKHFF